MARPVDGPDDWWLAVLWVADAGGIVSFHEVAPASGPPPGPPLLRLGPSLAGSLSGLIREVDGRLAIRLVPLVPPEDDTRPWRAPPAIPAGVPWGPAPPSAIPPHPPPGPGRAR